MGSPFLYFLKGAHDCCCDDAGQRMRPARMGARSQALKRKSRSLLDSVDVRHVSLRHGNKRTWRHVMSAERGLLLRMRTVEGPPYTTFSGLFENARHERAKAFPAKRLAAIETFSFEKHGGRHGG